MARRHDLVAQARTYCTGAADPRVASKPSAAEGVPPRCRWTGVFTRDSGPVCSSSRIAGRSVLPPIGRTSEADRVGSSSVRAPCTAPDTGFCWPASVGEAPSEMATMRKCVPPGLRGLAAIGHSTRCLGLLRAISRETTMGAIST